MGSKGVWQIQEAKARLTEVVRLAEREGPQTITRHGEPVAVLVSEAEYERLRGKPRESLVALFSRFDLGDLEVPERERSDLGRGVDLS